MKNWRTTLFGALASAMAASYGVVQVAQDNAAGWLNVGLAAVLAGLGWVAKDAGQTGPAK